MILHNYYLLTIKLLPTKNSFKIINNKPMPKNKILSKLPNNLSQNLSIKDML